MDSFIKSVKKLIKSCDCNYKCNAKWFKRNFKNWTSGNYHVNKLIQNTQLTDHNHFTCQALEWIPYDRLCDSILYVDKIKTYRAKWIDGCINKWDDENQNWMREDQNMFVFLKILNNPSSITLEFINKITIPHKVYGITRDPETKNYMVVLNDICEKCNKVCISIHFQRNFKNWTSGNNDIDKFIQDTQLSEHTYYQVENALEWIPYDGLDIYFAKDDEINKVYRANWIDGCINKWDDENQDWKRKDQNMFIILKILNNPASITSELNKIAIPHKVYGITQDPETKNYMVVLNDICEKCSEVCISIHTQRNFKNWTSEWIPYDRLDTYIAEDDKIDRVYRANWIDGCIWYWNNKNQNWKRTDQNMFVTLKILNNPESITSKLNKIAIPHKVYGITQDPETKNYMVVLNDICEKCNEMCISIHFQRNFKNWTSGNNDIDKFIQDTQLSKHTSWVQNALEWIPYDKLNKYIVEDDELDKMYIANWIDGCICYWNNKNQNWKRIDQNMFVTLKILNNPGEMGFSKMDFSQP
ncbi:hypothetical protein RhiirA5_412666 [Rhizophagus irregularis]|uniref:Uncharacterized protein n=1 Tax=Rhizophagus irregularis TaxID=588596 RepID=A0A2N0PYA1_9GLOM|nr:hypothetical protein RhiirA5_412666 [Rhizophagus irregularis]